MPGPIVHLGAVVTCSHVGPAQPLTPFPRVLVSGQPVVTQLCQYAITGCALTGTPTPPCVTALWVTAALRVLAGGVPVVVQAGQSVCLPTGTPLIVIATQPRVVAT